MAEENMEALQEGTTPSAEQSSETAEAEEISAAPEAEVENAEQSEESEIADNSESGSDGDIFSVTVNHETKSLNRDEAIKYAQLGMRHEYLEPFIAKLDYLAAVKGVSREEFIEKQIEAYENGLREDIIGRFGDDEEIVNDMLELTRQKHRKAYDDMIAKRQKTEEEKQESTETRLAEEFAGLAAEFPELEGKQFKDLPTAVKQAGFKGEKLLNAYLYHKHTEGKRIAEADKNKKIQESSSAGSMNANNDSDISPEEVSFKNSLWGR